MACHDGSVSLVQLLSKGKAQPRRTLLDERVYARELVSKSCSVLCWSPAVEVEATGPVEIPLTDEAVLSSMAPEPIAIVRDAKQYRLMSGQYAPLDSR